MYKEQKIEYKIKIAANGYTVTTEEAEDTTSFAEYIFTDYVFTDKDSLIAWLQGALK